MKKLYYNSGYFFLILFAFVLTGFYKTYFGLFPVFDKSTTWLVHIHAALLVSWVILLIVQPLLIRYKKTKLHKQIGKLTYVLVPFIVCSMIGMILKILTEIPDNPSLFLIFANIKFALFDCILFVTFYSLAVIRRKNFQQHGAFMIATGLVFINPSLSRLLFFLVHLSFPVAEIIAVLFIDLTLLFLLLYFRQKNLSTKPYGFVLLAFLFCHAITTSLIIWGPPV
ncbi:MAG TPA: hypothetical protein VGM30_21040 [Puia sp.]|jgi:hypothetical protein